VRDAPRQIRTLPNRKRSYLGGGGCCRSADIFWGTSNVPIGENDDVLSRALPQSFFEKVPHQSEGRERHLEKRPIDYPATQKRQLEIVLSSPFGLSISAKSSADPSEAQPIQYVCRKTLHFLEVNSLLLRAKDF
jgi:hypothetical protein